jgi:hypothetical protein
MACSGGGVTSAVQWHQLREESEGEGEMGRRRTRMPRWAVALAEQKMKRNPEITYGL